MSNNPGVPNGNVFLSTRNLFLPVCFAVILILFFFAFCRIRPAGKLKDISPAQREVIQSLSGLDFITGTAIPAIVPERIPISIWAILTLTAAAAGLLVSMKGDRKGARYGLLTAIAGGIALLLLGTAISYGDNMPDSMGAIRAEISFQWAYWAALGAFALAGCLNAWCLLQKSDEKKPKAEKRQPSTTINIHIITQHSDNNSATGSTSTDNK